MDMIVFDPLNGIVKQPDKLDVIEEYLNGNAKDLDDDSKPMCQTHFLHGDNRWIPKEYETHDNFVRCYVFRLLASRLDMFCALRICVMHQDGERILADDEKTVQRAFSDLVDDLQSNELCLLRNGVFSLPEGGHENPDCINELTKFFIAFADKHWPEHPRLQEFKDRITSEVAEMEQPLDSQLWLKRKALYKRSAEDRPRGYIEHASAGA